MGRKPSDAGDGARASRRRLRAGATRARRRPRTRRPPPEGEEPPADAGARPRRSRWPTPAGDLGEDRPPDLPDGAEAAPGEILVRFRRGADAEEREEARD
ncbi:MAG: hypothetical protein WKF31_10805 [Thermoleophilaceae bacterium]